VGEGGYVATHGRSTAHVDAIENGLRAVYRRGNEDDARAIEF
jgi:hypothetical protein